MEPETRHSGNLEAGVGIVLDAGKPARLKSLTVQTDTPGFTAIVKAAASSTGPFQTISQQWTVQRRTTIALNETAPAQYDPLWITSLAPGTGPNFQAHVNEVTVDSGSSRRPGETNRRSALRDTRTLSGASTRQPSNEYLAAASNVLGAADPVPPPPSGDAVKLAACMRANGGFRPLSRS